MIYSARLVDVPGLIRTNTRASTLYACMVWRGFAHTCVDRDVCAFVLGARRDWAKGLTPESKVHCCQNCTFFVIITAAYW
jgi:hypothetical protein